MTSIDKTFINALLADATYRTFTPSMDSTEIVKKSKDNLTTVLAEFLASNFEVVSAIDTSDIPILGSGFDATVFRGRINTPYVGQVYVSTRGTEPPGVDLWGADIDLALNTAARSQIIDMVNWWLRETTPSRVSVHQVKWNPLPISAP